LAGAKHAAAHGENTVVDNASSTEQLRVLDPSVVYRDPEKLQYSFAGA
jgi:hypothetical protein